MVEVLDRIMQSQPFKALYSHEETGNGFTYERDKKVASWCKAQKIEWHEYAQFGVVRRLKSRDLWKQAWEKHMSAPINKVESIVFWKAPAGASFKMFAPTHLRHNPTMRQVGGRKEALYTLHNFLNARSIGYRGGISSPLSAPNACSRLSAYLTYGCVSMREVVQQTRLKLDQLPTQAQRHRLGLSAFISRLYWHCHFIQKLESEPEIEWRNMHRGYDNLREHDFNSEYFKALKEARTGWPMVDACVNMLKETGWLNFRMRAMLVSVAAYPLWLHWREVGEWLATQFLDYEPGIHWSQMQMQSGTTGINATRVYNPIKQAKDHDPKGIFVRRWLPSLQKVPDIWIFEPWKMPAENRTMMLENHPIYSPIVDLSEATRIAKSIVHDRRNQDWVRSGKKAVIDQHASRKPSVPISIKTLRTSVSPKQLEFNF
jgi:deoxyribodipyrimidine photo-lyase